MIAVRNARKERSGRHVDTPERVYDQLSVNEDDASIIQEKSPEGSILGKIGL